MPLLHGEKREIIAVQQVQGATNLAQVLTGERQIPRRCVE